MSGKRSVFVGVGGVVSLLWCLLGSAALFGADLGAAQLRIAGSRLTVSPESQAVPYDTPTQVETHLEGYDPALGVLPQGLRVLADFTGPEIDGILVLETLPNQPFRIPRLRLQGEYRLDNIRLVQGDDLVAYAEPRSAAVAVTQILVTRVTSRALTLDEIRSYGIVVNDDSFQAFNFTFAFAVAGETVNYNVPVIYSGPNREQQAILWSGQNFEAPPWRSSSTRFEPPRMAPFQLHLVPLDRDASNGGCDDPEGDCSWEDAPPIPGVILFPTDVGLLHQFFSVTLIAQNGAPAGSQLVLRDLTAKVTLPPGLRQAETEPPTPLGVPVPIRVPGPDGELGTGDDLTFLIAQASGKAEALVEGLREGTHVVRFDLEGVLEGLPGGAIRRVTGQASGAVIVRDPSLNITITHPDTVRTDEEYAMLLTVTNTGAAPANLLKVRLPAEKLSGVEVVGEAEKTVTVAPGDSELVEFRLRSRRTGRVTATAARSSAAITPSFELTVGVGENGIPLSPNAIILPRSTGSLAPELVRQSLNLIGLGFSLATAPAALLRPDLPRVSRSTVDSRVYQLAQAGRHVALGEEAFDSLAQLAVEWSGGRDAEWEWDRLRRTTQKGARVGALLGAAFAAEAAVTSPQAAFERFGRTATRVAPVAAVLGVGLGLRLEVVSQTSGQSLSGSGSETGRRRDLPFGDLYELGGARLALLAVPEEGGYEARFHATAAVSGDLHLLLPEAGSGSVEETRRVHWPSILLDAGGVATLRFRRADASFTLGVDVEGDGTVDQEIPGLPEPFAPRPFEVLAAQQNSEVDPTGHVVDVLFSGDVDPASLALPIDPRRFSIPGKVSNGGWVQGETDSLHGVGGVQENLLAGMRNNRVVRVSFNNPLSPYSPQSLTVSGVSSRRGETVGAETVLVATTAAMPGTLVEGKVYGADGQAVPFAEVTLRESDLCLFCEESCRAHKTAIVRADSSGAFLFDYVRQTECGDGFQIEAVDAANGRTGSATGRVRFVGQRTRLDIVMLGRGSVRGRVTWDDGTVPPKGKVAAYSPVFREGRSRAIDADGNYELTEIPVGTITLSANDGEGRFTVQTIEIPEAGSALTRHLVILRHPDRPQASGEVRGTVFRPDQTTPVAGAYVALYVEGTFLGSRRSGSDGRFDFGKVPAGQGEVEAFEGETGISGGQIFFAIRADQVNEVAPILRDDRGVVQGHVYRQTVSGLEPLFGIVVWAEGTPFRTVTNAEGFYRLEGVFAGSRSISAADLARQVRVSEGVTLTAEGQVVERNLYFRETTTGGITGTVLDFDGHPVANATVHLGAGDQHWFRTATSDAAGHFLIADLAPGGYSVHAFKGAVGATRSTLVRFPGDTPSVTLRFQRGTIRGVVKAENESGAPLGVRALVTYRTTVVRLEMLGLDLQSHTLETAADGTFEIPNVLAGQYVLSVSNAFYGNRTVRGEIFEHGEVRHHTVTFERDSTGSVGGVVFAPDGVTPVAGAEVKLHHPAFSDYDLITDAEGRFRFEFVPPTANAFRVEVTASSGVVFRTAEAWVRVSQGGQDLDLQVVLPKQGSVAGTVVDSGGAAVPGAVVTLQESAYPRRRLVANADGVGAFAFQNVFVGTLTLAARAPALGGLGGKTTAELSGEGEALEGVTIELEPTGRIAGRVTSPVDGSAVAAAEVRLLRGVYHFDTVTASPDGTFEFALLPLGEYSLRAFDPRTGRFGRRADLAVVANDDTVEGDVVLEVRGTVGGHLYEGPAGAGIPGATIRMQTLGIEGFTTYSSSGAEGAYLFEGVPQGEFRLTAREPLGRRNAYGVGEIVSEDQHVDLDLTLEATVTLRGRVLNPPGAPAGTYEPANTVLTQDGVVVGSSVEGTYSFPGLVVGHPYELYSTEIGGGVRPHVGWVLGNVPAAPPGGEVEVDVPMRALGSVSVDVVTASGVPVPGVQVRLQTETQNTWDVFTGQTGADGSVVFHRVAAGRLSTYLYNPVNGLKGSGGGWVTEDGALVHIVGTLQPSARIRGIVLRPDGETPAAGARIAVLSAGRYLAAQAGADGSFEIPSIPLGAFTLTATEDFAPGSREVLGELTANAQDLDLGTLVLDDVNPYVVSIDPPQGAVDVPLGAAVVVRFNEPLDPARNLLGNVAHLEVADSAIWVGADVTLEEGGKAVRVTPRQPLRNFTSYRVKVSDLLYDLAGRRPSRPWESSFNTADAVGPAVIETHPTANARKVALGTPLRILFSEPVVAATLSGSALSLLDVSSSATQTLTFQLDSSGRSLVVTPVAGLTDGHRYRLTLQGVTDAVGNAMAAPFQLEFQALDAAGPAIVFQQPAAGAAFTSGARIVISADATDLSAVAGLTLRFNGRSFTDSAAPFAWNVAAPPVATAQELDLELEGVDEWGNHATVSRSVDLEPRADSQAPAVELRCLPTAVVPGLALLVPFGAEDDQGIASYRLKIDGAVVATVAQDDESSELSALLPWTVLSNAAPGSSVAVRVEVLDFAGNVGAAEISLPVVAGEPLTGGRALDATDSGRSLVLSGGTFTLAAPLQLANLTLLRDARLTSSSGGKVELNVSGRLEIGCEATIDVARLGFPGGTSQSDPGKAPSGVRGAGPAAGGSHGGAGYAGLRPGALEGAIFDSVVRPGLGGGGGGKYNNQIDGTPGGAGGGVISLTATEVVLDGRLDATGGSLPAPAPSGPGAGGTIAIRASTLRGAGAIDASGGTVEGCLIDRGLGGGGRVALAVDDLSGFDPILRVRAWGGGSDPSCHQHPPQKYGVPGTVYLFDSASTYGRLVIDAGQLAGADRVGGQTELPALGSGSVASLAAAGADGWLTGASPFGVEWLGAWVNLAGTGGSPIGTGFQVVEIDAAGRARLAGAAAAAGAATYLGEHRFDGIELLHGAGLVSASPVVGGTVVLQGDTTLDGAVEASNLLVKSGALVRPSAGGELRFRVSGRMTVEAGAEISVQGRGYPGGLGSSTTGRAPAGVAGSTSAAGGSHGGSGSAGTKSGAQPGPVFDSVVRPRLAGGGGGKHANQYSSGTYGPGGGFVSIVAGELVLEGRVDARGGDTIANDSEGSGAGGSVVIEATVLSGAGTIDASGGEITGCNPLAGAGGGGRVALKVGDLSGFDPAAQVRVWGGTGYYGCPQISAEYGSAGTVYLFDSTSTYGRLVFEGGAVGATDRQGAPTQLPALPGGDVTAFTAAGDDAWVAAAVPLSPVWDGAWMTLSDATGAPLGSGFEVVEVDSAGRARLAGAGSVAGAARFAGEYRFDRIETLRGGLWSSAPIKTGELIARGPSRVGPGVSATTATVKSQGRLRQAVGDTLRLVVAGRLTVEAGGAIDLTGQGYPAIRDQGGVPAGVRSPTLSSGGNHGGSGLNSQGLDAQGETYDSVLQPVFGGGGGSHSTFFYGLVPTAGGGVVDLEVGTLDLQGSILARGQDNEDLGTPAGAGGTVRIHAQEITGGGSIDASGGSSRVCWYQRAAGSGGGGRVALHAGSFDGFDPASAVVAKGGGHFNCDSTIATYAAPGTIFSRHSGQTHGELRVDQGPAGGSPAIAKTVLPAIGSGVVGAVETDATDPADLWITPQSPTQTFGNGVAGLRVRANGADHLVLAVSADRRRLLLEGAAGHIAVGDPFAGLFLLDRLTVSGRARLETADGIEAGVTVVDPGATLSFLDVTGPAASIESPASGALFSSGATVAVTASVTDPSGVASVTFWLGDRTFTDSAAPYEWTAPAPVVATAGDLAITVESLDGVGNRSTVTRMIHVEPVSAGATPDLVIDCPSPGAILAPGTSLLATLSASHASGIDRAELYLGSTLVATDFASPYSFAITAPPGTADGVLLDFRLRVRSFSGTSAEAALPVKVVQGSVLTADQTLAAGDASLDGVSVVVAGGTLTVSGQHTFRDLVVLDGGRVAPAETTSSSVGKLDLGVQRDLYVSCGGRIDAEGRGYLGALAAADRASGYPNSTAEGAAAGVAGSHGGRGGRFDGSSPVYGSFFDPLAPGAGGGYSSGKGRDGGGIIRITALGPVAIDGRVTADGETGSTGAGGAGGSVRLNASEIRGLGLVTARGSAGAAGIAGGSGGRVALYATAIDAGLVGRTSAAGAATGSTDATTWGAAGTIFVKPDAQGLGDLILDNGGTASSQWTELPSVGRGTVDTVTSDGFTDAEGDFAHDLRAVEVYFKGDLSSLFAVLGHSHHGTALTLSVPTPPLSAQVAPGDIYAGLYRFHRILVRGGARGLTLDRVTSAVSPDVAAGSTWTESYAPAIELTSPDDGATFHPGDAMVVSAAATDLLGLREVELKVGGASIHDTAAPYTWTTSAPAVTEATDFTVTATALDLSGHEFRSTRTIHVVPLVAVGTPVVSLGACPADGDLVLPGVAVAVKFSATDDQALASVSLVVDGTTVQTATVSGAAATPTLNWTPPAGAAAGTRFDLRVEARDAAGNLGYKTLSLFAPPASALAGPLTLDSSRNGQALVLKSGTFTVSGPLSLVSLTLVGGAKMVPASGQTLDLTVGGEARVQCGAELDATGKGYAGALGYAAGSAPAGVVASAWTAGGSHGGVGAKWGNFAGAVGEVFDSVYRPRLGGGGGSNGGYAPRAGNGGGAIALSAGQIRLDGTMRSGGEQVSKPGNGDASGAGGSVLLMAGSLSGVGTIDVSGGDHDAHFQWGSSGGGGRIALYVDSLGTFDPLTQTNARGGATLNGTTPLIYGGPGTVFVKQAAETYGRLIVDSGKQANGSERIGPVTPLPVLGSGAVSAFAASGGDAWVSGPAAFKAQWAGAWMQLLDASGGSLGSYRVASIDGQGKALLAGAGAASGAASYRGQYRFDRVDLKAGAGLSHTDELVAGDLFADAKSRIPAKLSATNVTVKPGAAVTLASGGSLSLDVIGRLTIEAGGALDVTGKGYAGAVGYAAGSAPVGVTASGWTAGGSHGGLGAKWGNYAGPVGDVFDSVYRPQLGGGGGSNGGYAPRAGNGGGAIAISAGEVRLDGTLRSRGEQVTNPGNGDASGAGGSVLLVAGSLFGSGTIDASGPDHNAQSQWGSSGGGGRIALYVDSLGTFDPLTQTNARGGATLNGTTPLIYAGPGTVFVKQGSETYGRLIVDSGKEANGSERVGPVTPLPSLGSGAVSTFAASGSDAWVAGPAAFKAQWSGAWMQLLDGAGGSLGSYRVASIDGQGKALLVGAGAASGAASYRGQYRFDRVDLKAGAGLSHTDELVAGDLFADAKSRIPAKLSATNVTVKPGSAVTLAQGGSLALDVIGRLTIEAGAVLDATAKGYAGATTSFAAGTAPAGVVPSGWDAGGSHGGLGAKWGNFAGPVGEVFGSVYRPQLGGGGGSNGGYVARSGNGGGVISITAGEVRLDGTLRTRGEQINNPGQNDSGGAGGSVLLIAGSLFGSGTIDASGPDHNAQSQWGSSGGGGRIALYVDSLGTFDPLTQINARGGATLNGTVPLTYAAPGTVFVKLPGQTYGKLIVDQGGVAGKPIANTPLPTLGTGTIGTTTPDAVDPADVWIEPANPNAKFDLGAAGMWLRVEGTDYRVLDQSADRRRLLLDGGAATVTTGLSYRGVYKLDEVVVRGGAKLEFRDTSSVGAFTVDATSSVTHNVP